MGGEECWSILGVWTRYAQTTLALHQLKVPRGAWWQENRPAVLQRDRVERHAHAGRL